MDAGTKLVQFSGAGTSGEIKDLNAAGVGVVPNVNNSNSYSPSTGVLSGTTYTFTS